MSLRTRNTRSNSGLSIERTIFFMKKGWYLTELTPKDTRYCVGFRLTLPDNLDAPTLLVHHSAAASLLLAHTGKEITSIPKRFDEPRYYIRHHVWTDNPTASSDTLSQ